MRVLHGRIFGLAVLAGLAGCTPQGLDSSGAGAPAPLDYADPGTRITLANQVDGVASETEITAAPPLGLQGAFTRADGSTGSFYPGCWGCGAPNRIEEDLYAALWPLETGKQVTFLRTEGDGTQARVVIRVAGVERIETRAGRFDTYLLKGQISNITGARWSAQVDAWWAPEPGWVVKAEGSDSAGRSLLSEAVTILAP
ncbi:MAG: hypothetical protein AAF415_06245 [Pseudomonadota bacterium]